MIFFVFHFDISGNEDKDLQPKNKYSIFVTLFKFHCDISGKNLKDLQSVMK